MWITKPLTVAILYIASAWGLPITLLAQSGRDLPLSPPSPRNMAQCDQLQSQWDALRQQVQSQHQQCLNAHSSEPSNPYSGSGPGSACSHAGCQNLHTELFTILAPRETAAVQQCRNLVAQFQQQQRTQTANANQPANGPAQMSLQLEVNQLRAQAQRLSIQAGQNAQAAQSAQLQALLRQARTLALAQASANQQANSGQSRGGDWSASSAPDHSSLQSALGSATVPDAPRPSGSVFPESDAIPPAALDSSDPDVQAKVQQIQTLDKNRADIQALQAGQLKNLPDDATTAMIAAVLSPSEALKGSADATATAIGLEGGPMGKAFSAEYGVVTNIVSQTAEHFADGGEGSSSSAANGHNAPESAELSGKMAEGVSFLGELMKEDREAASTQKIIGGSLEGVGNAVALGINATQAYDAYNEGKYMDAAANSASAIGGTAKVAGQLGEALEIAGASAVKGTGESITAAAGLAQAGQTFAKGVSDAWDSYGAPGRVLEQYSNAFSNETAVVQRLTDERNAAYLELLNLLYQKSNGAVSISVPGSAPSANPAPQNPIPVPILFP